ncbi:MAG: Arylsulfatase [candidate division BRC1 bacterium ADurb.BinA364]|nr:MAG: Arylsulfatase [candidate division BRC1 bacterium ADurb.BinA364]
MHSKTTFLLSLSIALASFALPIRAGDPARPNVVIMLTDDQGYGDVGCYGATGFETPNLDRLAAEGMRFTNFYATHASCSPTRASLMTGCYPWRAGVPGVLGPGSLTGLNADIPTIAEVFKASGYATACFGKWHLGSRPEFMPTRHGFDVYFGLPYSNDMWPWHPTGGAKYPDLPLVDMETVVELNPDQTQLTTWYTERAVAFIESSKDEPFFLYLPHSMPHVPLFVSDKFKGKSEQGLYGDVIMEIDWSMGRILDALERTGAVGNTFVMFTSDNGPWLSYGNHAGSAGPLREGKGTTFDGGQREACLMRWPGVIPAGSVCDETASVMDPLPTFAAFLGYEMPEGHAVDGHDIMPLLRAEPGAKSPYEAFLFYNGNDLEAIRADKWKLHLPHKYRTIGPSGPGRDGEPGPYIDKEIGPALFDLTRDIGETNDLAAARPRIVERLTAQAQALDAELKAKQLPTGRAPKESVLPLSEALRTAGETKAKRDKGE